MLIDKYSNPIKNYQNDVVSYEKKKVMKMKNIF